MTDACVSNNVGLVDLDDDFKVDISNAEWEMIMSSDLPVMVKKYARPEASSLGKLLQLGEKDMVNTTAKGRVKGKSALQSFPTLIYKRIRVRFLIT